MERRDDEIMAIRVTMMPADTNAHGTIFGGRILSLIDQGGAIAAHASGAGRVVTVSMHAVTFKEPVHVGDLVTCFARTLKVGRTSVTVEVRVVAQMPYGDDMAPRDVTSAEVVYVNVDERGKPCAVGEG